MLPVAVARCPSVGYVLPVLLMTSYFHSILYESSPSAMWALQTDLARTALNARHCYPHMPIGKVWIYRLLFVRFLFVCTVMDFSAEDKASGVKFCMTIRRRPRQGISHFEELRTPRSSPRSPKSDGSSALPAPWLPSEHMV